MLGKTMEKYKVVEVLLKNLHKTLQNEKGVLSLFFFCKHLNITALIVVTANHYSMSSVNFYNCSKKNFVT